MSIDSHGSRLSRRDVTELATASEQLAVAAETIRRMRPAWGESVVNLLIAANLVIERIQNKGAATFARYLQKHGPQMPQDARDPADPDDQSDQVRPVAPGKEET
jgi:hypothetical protein